MISNNMGSATSMCMQKFDIENPQPRPQDPETPHIPEHIQDPHECIIHNDVYEKNETPFMKDVVAFSKEFDKPNSLIGDIQRVFPAAVPELTRQMQTFVGDMRKFENGEMSYAEMRMLYG